MADGDKSPLGSLSSSIPEDSPDVKSKSSANLREGLCVPTQLQTAFYTVQHCRVLTSLGAPLFRLGKEDEIDGVEESEGGSISIAQILSLKERFDRADTDGGGSLDLQEFMDAFGSIINKDGSMSGMGLCSKLFT